MAIFTNHMIIASRILLGEEYIVNYIMKKLLIASIIGFVFFSCDTKTTDVDSPEELIAEYCKSSPDTNYRVALEKILPADLFDGKTVIACGQATHGSHENFVIQAELFKYLVEKKGCRTFIIEGNYAWSMRVNKYITGTPMTRDEVMKTMGFWVWDTEEVWELIEWIRIHNETASDAEKIMFVGNDIQGVRECAKGAFSFFAQYGAEYMDSALHLLEPLIGDTAGYYSKWESNSDSIFADAIPKLERWSQLVKHEESDIQQSSFLAQRYCITILAQSLAFSGLTYGAQSLYRDSVMAENVRWFVNAGLRSGPVYIWAHNEHVKKDDRRGYRMGTLLSDWYGDKYFVMGVDFVEGSFNARVPLGDSMGPKYEFNNFSSPQVCFVGSDTNNLANKCMLSSAGITFFNSGKAAADSRCTNSKWYHQSRLYTIGAAFDTANRDGALKFYLPQVNPGEEYDGLLFFSRSTPTRLLHTIRENGTTY